MQDNLEIFAKKKVWGLFLMLSIVDLELGSAFLAHFGSLGYFFYGMALFIAGGNFLAMKIIPEITEIKVFILSLIKLSMKFRY
jgi:hypothetical protein